MFSYAAKLAGRGTCCIISNSAFCTSWPLPLLDQTNQLTFLSQFPPLSKTFFLTFVKDLKRIGLVIVEPRLGNYELSWPRSVLQLKMHTGCPKKKQLKETNPKQHCLIDVEPNFPLDMTWECLILLSLSKKRPKKHFPGPRSAQGGFWWLNQNHGSSSIMRVTFSGDTLYLRPQALTFSSREELT